MSDKETNLIASFAFFVDTRNSSSFSSVSPLADVRPAQVAGSSLILSGGRISEEKEAGVPSSVTHSLQR